MHDADEETKEARLNLCLEPRSNTPRQKNGESDVALVPSRRIFSRSLFPVFLTARPDEPTYRPDGP
jgi:hypothetical protein